MSSIRPAPQDRDAHGPVRTPAERRPRLGLLATALVLAALVTLTWYRGSGRIHLPADLLKLRDAPIHAAILSGAVHVTEVRENGEPVGPEVGSWPEMSARDRGSWWQKVIPLEEGRGSVTVVALVTSDTSSPAANGRAYEARYALRSHPPAVVAMLLTWLLVPAAAVAGRRRSGRPEWIELGRLSPPHWTAIAAVAVYTAFSLQAELSLRPALAWFLALSALAVPGLVARVRSGIGLPLRGPWPWLTGLLAWSLATVSFAPDPSASARTVLLAIVGCAFGGCLLLAFRGVLTSPREPVADVLTWTWLAATAAVAYRAAGLDLLGGLEAVGLTSPFTANPWTEKLSVHWLVVLAWCVVLAAAHRGRRASLRGGTVLLVTLLAVWLAGSKTAVAALLVGLAAAGAALRWPRLARRTVIGGAVAVLLAAPLVYRVPWAVQQTQPTVTADAARLLDLTVRGGIWEHTGRLVAERPWAGWGAGSGATMPGSEVPLGDVLGIPPEEQSEGQRINTGLPGGHPHSLPLLVWLELGLAGAVLLGGMLLAVGRAVGRYETSHGTHGALLGLTAVTLAVLAVNYPVWHPVVLSILWMGAAVAGALVPSAGGEV